MNAKRTDVPTDVFISVMPNLVDHARLPLPCSDYTVSCVHCVIELLKNAATLGSATVASDCDCLETVILDGSLWRYPVELSLVAERAPSLSGLSILLRTNRALQVIG